MEEGEGGRRESRRAVSDGWRRGGGGQAATLLTPGVHGTGSASSLEREAGPHLGKFAA